MDPTTLPADVQSLTIDHGGSTIPIHEHPVIKNTPDLPTAFKRLIEQDAEVNRRIRLPGPDAKPEDIDGLFNKLGDVKPPAAWLRKARGAPEKPADYQYDKPADLPPGLTWNEEAVGKARDLAHKHGWSKEEFSDAIKFHNEFMARMVGEQMNVFQGVAGEDGLKALKADEEFGGAKFEENWALANQGAEKFFNGDQKLVELLAKTGLAFTPMFAKRMKEYALATGEDAGLTREPSLNGASVDAAIAEITRPGTEKFKLWQQGNADVLAELQVLYNKKNNGKMVSLS